MRTAAALLALAFALPASAASLPAKKILGESADLIVSVTATGPGGPLTSRSRVQAQSQFHATTGLKAKSPSKELVFSGVPVINPNNGKARMEYKGRAAWGMDTVEFMSAVELELGAEAVVYDSEGVTVRIKITAAD